MGNQLLLLASPYILLSGLGFLIMGYDKSKAKAGTFRIREGRLLLIAFAGGAFGVYLGMKVFHHKTKHFSFTFGVPLMVLLNLILYVLANYFLLKLK